MLTSWAANPDRFREDANAEDGLARGPYRDRAVVELVQDAADASALSGEPGVLALRLSVEPSRGAVLSAAGTGAPLDVAGVRALASLRASAKRGGGTVGRFGVGFAAVAAVCDEVELLSTSGGVRFSRTDTLEAVARVPSLAAELAERGGHVPLLRLPFAAYGPPAAGMATEVRLSLRADAVESVRGQLEQVDAALLLALPALSRLDVDGRVLESRPDGDDVLLCGRRWRVERRHGELDSALLSARPVEERARRRWEVTVAVPVDQDGTPQPVSTPVLHAPTPTDDPLSLSVVVIATLPVGDDRRRVVPGPLADAVLAHVAAAVGALALRLAEGPERLTLVPGPLAAGELDAVLGRDLLRALRGLPVLADGRLARDAVVLDGACDALVDVLAELLPGLLPASWSRSRWSAPLSALGVARLDLAGLTELLAGVDRAPCWWRALYEALPLDRDALGALPVPLADGRLAPSARGLLLPDGALDLGPLGRRTVHPDAAHPLLQRLGAVPPSPGGCSTSRGCAPPSRPARTRKNPPRSARPCWAWSAPPP